MAHTNSKRILLVEDSMDLQALLSELFKSEGYVLSQAYDGRQALDLLHSGQELPSVILLDVMMPVMDGIEFRQAQKQDPLIDKIPVVVMSADSNSQAKAKMLDVNEFIRKPIDNVDKLLEIVERVRLQA